MERLDASQSTKTLLLLTMLGLLGTLFCHPAAAQARGAAHRHDSSGHPYTGGNPTRDSRVSLHRFQLYSALVRDLSQGDRLPDLVPGLAESWEVTKTTPPNGSSSCAVA